MDEYQNKLLDVGIAAYDTLGNTPAFEAIGTALDRVGLGWVWDGVVHRDLLGVVWSVDSQDNPADRPPIRSPDPRMYVHPSGARARAWGPWRRRR